MLKKRLIASIFIRDGIAVQSIGFRKYLPVGRPEIAAEAFNMWGIDEIMLIDISAGLKGSLIDIQMVERVARACSVPLTVGGGITCIADMGRLLSAGADKVSVNYANLDNTKCLEEGRAKFGRQCMVAVIDFVESAGKYLVFDYRLGKPLNETVEQKIESYIDAGAGEIFINDVQRDGSQKGFNLDAINQIASSSSVPVTWCGGAGHPNDFLAGLQTGVLSGIAAGNIFHYFEHSINIVKSLIGTEMPIRQDLQANYENFPLSESGRLSKLPEECLQDLLYEKLEVEVI